MHYVENRTFDELSVGDDAELTRTVSEQDVALFAAMAGEVAAGRPAGDLAATGRPVLAHGLWGGMLISSLVDNELPGPGTAYVDQSLHFHRPVGLGDVLTVRVTVREKDPATRHLRLACLVQDRAGETVIEGEAVVRPSAQRVRRPRALLPDAALRPRGSRYDQLIESTRALAPIRTAVVHPCDEPSLVGALDAMVQGLIVPVLVGPRARIEAAAAEAGRSLADIELVAAPHSHAAAEQAVALARSGQVDALMKGALHTDEVMAAAIDRTQGLRTERRMSHVFVFDVSTYPKPLLISDAAINIAPDLDDKRDIVQNAIDLAHALGIALPKVAVLSAVETVYAKIASTVEAAALCKMADRGQITGGLLDGPLAFDNAISRQAADAKQIRSAVAGDADILIVPDLEAGNMLAKQLVYLAGADSAGIVLGARVPIMLTSRADGTLARLASCALAQRFVHHRLASAAGSATQ
ncbi:MAG: bifunctional enoyl-CoA hydratase/phosphate acetyltransferase [Alphaproteobacteria bacterium]